MCNVKVQLMWKIKILKYKKILGGNPPPPPPPSWSLAHTFSLKFDPTCTCSYNVCGPKRPQVSCTCSSVLVSDWCVEGHRFDSGGENFFFPVVWCHWLINVLIDVNKTCYLHYIMFSSQLVMILFLWKVSFQSQWVHLCPASLKIIKNNKIIS